jgi:hypothetical protein
MKGLTTMNENYLTPVAIKDVKLHGDFYRNEATVTVLRVKNFRVERSLPVVTCKDPDGFEEETSYKHTPELYIRSNLMLFKGFEYDVEEVDWRVENEACKRAIAENETLEERGMTFAYDRDVENMFEASTTHHYAFDLPEEMLLVIPVDLNESQYEGMDKTARHKLVDHLAWRQMMTTLPISNIREVENEDPEVTKLNAIKDFVEATMDEMFTRMEHEDIEDYSPYEVSISLNGQTFKLGCCAKEYNGLLEYIEYMKSEV